MRWSLRSHAGRLKMPEHFAWRFADDNIEDRMLRLDVALHKAETESAACSDSDGRPGEEG